MLKFGTDGVRGRFGTELTESYAACLAEVAAQVLQCKSMIIGRDTRESGLALEGAIAKSLASISVDVQLMGVAPTPAIAFASAKSGVAAIAITASHNAFHDNGIKIFRSYGQKLSEAEQDEIEKVLAVRLAEVDDAQKFETERTGNQAKIEPRPELLKSYFEFLASTVKNKSLKQLHVVLDCANGAMSDVAPEIFAKLGATVTTINATPDGKNINHECGATHPAMLGEVVKQVGANFGVAYDGDGDRLIAIDGDGNIVNGDQLLAISAIEMKRQNTLSNNKVAVTVMTNIGFHLAMKSAGIDVITTPVGDRSVLVALEDNALSLGGEQSGHIIYKDLATTGDGLLASLKLAELVSDSGVTLRDLSKKAMTSFPQVLINVKVAKQVEDLEQLFQKEISSAEQSLAKKGRVLVRASGTEPVVRVMVEASEITTAESVAKTLVEAITKRLG